jgi:sugar phosphate isomerase/epimerase
MTMSRRSMIQQGLAGLAALSAGPAVAAAVGRPNSRIGGLQIGVISYSFRSMKDQSAEAILAYCRQLGINAIELMGDPVEWFAGIPIRFDISQHRQIIKSTAPGNPGYEAEMARYAEYRRAAAAWRAQVPMRRFVQLRQLYERAGVQIYAFKPTAFETDSTDAEIDYGVRAARALGADQATVELPGDLAQVRRLTVAGARHDLRVAFHEHTGATPTLWDAALAVSPVAAINLDLGHYIAADDYDGIEFIRRHHARIASMHLKDRRNRPHGQANMPWGQGDTPIVAALQLMREQHYGFPATIELEYEIPVGSDAVTEVGRCLDYCRKALI